MPGTCQDFPTLGRGRCAGRGCEYRGSCPEAPGGCISPRGPECGQADEGRGREDDRPCPSRESSERVPPSVALREALSRQGNEWKGSVIARLRRTLWRL